jgi:hypothetical protein
MYMNYLFKKIESSQGYHGSGHEEIPWQKGSQAQDEEDDPHSIVSGK